MRANDQKPSNDNWPFEQPSNCGVLTTRQVLEGLEPILLVSDDADDHGWQFIGSSDAAIEDCRVVSLAGIVKLDPTIVQVAHLPPGWQAVRDGTGCPWRPHPHPSADVCSRQCSSKQSRDDAGEPGNDPWRHRDSGLSQ
jgi:hypothetical protein